MDLDISESAVGATNTATQSAPYLTGQIPTFNRYADLQHLIRAATPVGGNVDLAVSVAMVSRSCPVTGVSRRCRRPPNPVLCAATLFSQFDRSGDRLHPAIIGLAHLDSIRPLSRQPTMHEAAATINGMAAAFALVDVSLPPPPTDDISTGSLYDAVLAHALDLTLARPAVKASPGAAAVAHPPPSSASLITPASLYLKGRLQLRHDKIRARHEFSVGMSSYRIVS